MYVNEDIKINILVDSFCNEFEFSDINYTMRNHGFNEFEKKDF